MASTVHAEDVFIQAHPIKMKSAPEIRKRIRLQRAKLSPHDQEKAANLIYAKIIQLGLLNRHQKFACYLPSQGEINTHRLIEKLWLQHKQCFLPVLHWSKQNKLQFLPFAPDTTLIINRYGILEPRYQSPLIQKNWSLDIIFMPLVAFDTSCNRVGMGGGYYDRTLNFLLQRKNWRKPKLIGLAYEFQKINQITAQPWDVTLDTVVTDQHVYQRKNKTQ